MRRRSRRGQGIAEAVTAAIILVPIALCLFDFLVVVIVNSMNDTACKNAARAAANTPNGTDAHTAAVKSLMTVHNPFLASIEVEECTYDGPATVLVKTRAVMNLPVPFPGYQTLTFIAQDVEPIVGTAPPP